MMYTLVIEVILLAEDGFIILTTYHRSYTNVVSKVSALIKHSSSIEYLAKQTLY